MHFVCQCMEVASLGERMAMAKLYFEIFFPHIYNGWD